MKTSIQKIQTNLWFNTEAMEAAQFYTSIFTNSHIDKTVYNGEGNVLTVQFQLEGQSFVALNGGPQYQFTPAVSFIVNCDTQEELDYYWNRLTERADEKDQVCGWLKDQYGVSWQIVPSNLASMLSDPDSEKSARVMNALLKMKKIDMQTLKQAYEG